MREIKFRAWDKLLGFMVEPTKYHITLDGQMYFNNDGDKYCQSEKLIAMQFTGLTDKNGVEIYEGDLISKDYPFDATENITTETGEVRYMECGFCIWFEDDYDAWCFLQDPSKRHYVVGNIYENPELLKLINLTDPDQ